MIQSKIAEKRRRDTVDFYSLGMILLFFLLLPYTVSILFGGNQGKEVSVVKSDVTNGGITRETIAGIEYIALEEYIIGAVAASIDVQYEEEMLKAQAIMIRTICAKAIENYGDDKKFVAEEKVELSYWSKATMEANWGKEYEIYYEKVYQAVSDTKDLCILYQGEFIEAAFFGLSNGNTRNAVELLGEEYGYLTAVSCEDAVLAENYLKEISWEKNDFIKKLESMTGEEQTGEITIIIDSMEYVTSVVIGQVEISGETFRKEFELLSSDFQIQEVDGKIVFTTKGIGHGIGVDQYQGNVMAKNGKNYFEILSYFYQDIEIAKYV
ncbi:MAG: SpoIID/LytB domain-containing protein [Eubacteriales bacterium]